MSNKDKEFWEELKRWDVMLLFETWVEEKGWSGIREKLPKGFSWGKQWAVREGRKGRARGGIIMGIRKELTEPNETIKVDTEGMLVGDVRLGEEKWKIIGVYVGSGIEIMARNVERWMEGRETGRSIIIGGDFNARVGRVGGGIEVEGGLGRERKAKDGKKNGEGRKLVSWLEEKGWGILNECTKGDEEGEYTFRRKR